ncbi:MAG: tRNA (adenosine(37)-N6)-threonylcarbamoyltransferase complex dimerization subunit type 1 TsaB [Tannerellaceae bacterium]|nr:tRNA (adenosine(37)-N6)-threonylcarbamoyltransferase complex dimerization subunit type 1 TsaB [Tannerellaceae bacterium]
MPCILHIETSTTICSVAVSEQGQLIFEKSSFEGPSHAALLGVFVEEALVLLKEMHRTPDAIAVSSGPGSYTGLRIGVSMAKGLCFGYGIPLIAIPTLEILASKAIRFIQGPEGSLYIPMLDARRMEVYAAIYDRDMQPVRETQADIVTVDTYTDFLTGHPVYFFGNGAAKCKEIIGSPAAFFIDQVDPLATDMIGLAEKAYHAGDFEDTAYFEPFYLKEFVATVAKNKILGNS